ncbi:MAG: IS1595 family transposase [Planctomycetota bacterium]
MTQGKKTPPNPLLAKLKAATMDEAKAVEFLEERRWGANEYCPKCGSVAVYTMKDKTTGERNKDNRWRCRDCKKMYTVRTGTVFEESRLPLTIWCYAIWKAASSKKGVSALQISRECEISYKTALFLMHRIRHAMGIENGPGEKLSGTVEADETYVGGKPRFKGVSKRGRGTKKTPVFGVVERDGKARLKVMERVNTKTLSSAITEHVDLSESRLVTDELVLYKPIGKAFSGGHETVNHSRREYARGDVHSNTIEGVFSLLKRGVYGTYHSISKKHLHRYLDEFAFRYNTRKMNDAERASAAVDATVGKRLTYEQQVS